MRRPVFRCRAGSWVLIGANSREMDLAERSEKSEKRAMRGNIGRPGKHSVSGGGSSAGELRMSREGPARFFSFFRFFRPTIDFVPGDAATPKGFDFSADTSP